MKKPFVLLTTIIVLSACTTVNQKDVQLQQEWAKEISAFEKNAQIATDECGYKQGEKRSREEAVPMAKCITRLVEENIMLQAKYPDLLHELRQADELRSKEYAEGQIYHEEFTLKGKNMIADYEQQWIARANVELAQTIEDQENARTLGKMFLGGVQAYNAAEQKRREEYERNKPIHCTTYGNSTTCNQY